MWLIYSCVVLGVFNLIMFILTSVKGAHMFKNRHPDIKIPKSHWSDHILTWIRLSIVCVLPILNIVLAWQLIFNNDDLCENAYFKLYKKYVKDAETHEV